MIVPEIVTSLHGLTISPLCMCVCVCVCVRACASLPGVVILSCRSGTNWRC